MTWWSWMVFWVVFWSLALAYLGWRTWKLWPHARGFGRTVSEALARLEGARALPSDQATSKELAGSSTERPTFAWDRPSAAWRADLRRDRKRQRELHLDKHAEVWAGWRDPVD